MRNFNQINLHLNDDIVKITEETRTNDQKTDDDELSMHDLMSPE